MDEHRSLTPTPSGQIARVELLTSDLPERTLELLDKGETPSIQTIERAAQIAAARVEPSPAGTVVKLVRKHFAPLFPEPKPYGWGEYSEALERILGGLPEAMLDQAFTDAIGAHDLTLHPPSAGAIKSAMPTAWSRWVSENIRLRGLANMIRHRAEIEARHREAMVRQNAERLAAFDRNNPNVIPLPAPSGFKSLAESIDAVTKAAQNEAERQKIEAREQARARRKAIADEMAARPKIALPHMPSGDEGNAETAEPGADGAATAAESAGGASGEG